MKILVESHIPFIHGVLEPLCDQVTYVASRDITPQVVADCDAMLVRTHTRCNAGLLNGSKVKFVATGTIGTDHFDIPYLESQSIQWHNAPGCNAPAVAQWVMAAIERLAPEAMERGGRPLTLGVVGVGHIGSIVDRWARGLGMRTLLCDPPRQRNGESGFVDLDTIAREADIITFHTPLTRSGQDATYHLCGMQFIDKLARKPIVLNASRGAVADTEALIHGLDSGKISKAAIDVWEGEPQLPMQLLERVDIGTPHIAGYSKAGKIRATAMIVKALADWLGVEMPQLPVELPPEAPATVTREMLNYDIMADDTLLRSAPDKLELLRDQYPLRDEIHD